jgi:hypothetical protein
MEWFSKRAIIENLDERVLKRIQPKKYHATA